MNILQRLRQKIITKKLKEKIMGKELENLCLAFGIIDKEYIGYTPENNMILKEYGKLSTQPTEKELIVKLEIFTDYVLFQPFKNTTIASYITDEKFSVQKTIPYSELQKLNLIQGEKN